jgi:hypothetical protein
MTAAALLVLSRRERKGPAAKRWEGEGLLPRRKNPSSPCACSAGPFFSLWEKTR